MDRFTTMPGDLIWEDGERVAEDAVQSGGTIRGQVAGLASPPSRQPVTISSQIRAV